MYRLSQDSLGTQLFSQVPSADYPTYSAESMLSFRTRIPLCEIAKLDQESIASTVIFAQYHKKMSSKMVIILVSQLTTPPEAYTKRKTLGNDTPIVYEDLGLAEICTPKMSSTKPLKNIKKEK
ncbi:hypothetical protein K1719_027241 [Acacia pycnantha]|nr:hypothetical protein K1719_027241 [Acacia pycnantha]